MSRRDQKTSFGRGSLPLADEASQLIRDMLRVVEQHPRPRAAQRQRDVLRRSGAFDLQLERMNDEHFNIARAARFAQVTPNGQLLILRRCPVRGEARFANSRRPNDREQPGTRKIAKCGELRVSTDELEQKVGTVVVDMRLHNASVINRETDGRRNARLKYI